MIMRNYVCGALILAAALLSGCGNGENANLTRQITTTGQYRSLEFTATSRAVYQRTEPVTVTFTVKNTSSQPFTYNYGGCDEYAVTVKREDQEISRIENCNYCSGNIKGNSLAAGETRIFTLTWNQRTGISCDASQPAVGQGEYAVQAGLTLYDVSNSLVIPFTQTSAAPLNIIVL